MEHIDDYDFEHIMLDLEKIKKDYIVKEKQKVENDEINNFYSFQVDEHMTIYCVEPPKEFPNHLLCFKFQYKEIDEYEVEERKIDTKNKLLPYEIAFEVDLREKNYWGVMTNLETKGYEYLIYRPNVENAVLAVEHKLKNAYEDADGKTDIQNIEYYKIGGFYCHTREFPEESFIELYKEFCERNLKPRWYSLYDLHLVTMPMGTINGKQLYWLSTNIQFASTISDYRHSVVTPYWVRTLSQTVEHYKETFGTAEELFYAFKKELPNLRDYLVIHEDRLKGKKLTLFEEKDKVQISYPSEKHTVLKDFNGIITKMDKTYAEVEFFSYFKEKFHVLELEKR